MKLRGKITKTVHGPITFVLTLLLMQLAGCGSSNKSKESGSIESKAVVIDETRITMLLAKNTCSACHKKEEKLVGPSFKAIASKRYSNERIVELVYKPEPENWPNYPAMAALPNIDEGELLEIAAWINSLR